ncbi:hypothetical protein ENSA5_30710 [Enhygromyxa salina]|uniref:Uncharacterized protein n=1 Tax=Enhygromyxa salina TaxID=215803 RepID=A0A2S9XZ10_9BACT|nr:DUF1328 domain-containing protein [Enhygromyxa salina]PRP98086.1 hypothetical protein ENSA5_30710 [Enhygromyxa salina]
MLYYALLFFIVAIIAGVLGFGVLAATAATVAKILFWGFLVIALVTGLMDIFGRRRNAKAV